MRRTLLGMSQTDLGKALDLAFQQVQKYESGVSRIGSSRLYQLSLIFGVPVEYFFEGLKEGAPTRSPDDVLLKTETMKLARAYNRIRDPKVRDALRRMAIAMGKGVRRRAS